MDMGYYSTVNYLDYFFLHMDYSNSLHLLYRCKRGTSWPHHVQASCAVRPMRCGSLSLALKRLRLLLPGAWRPYDAGRDGEAWLQEVRLRPRHSLSSRRPLPGRSFPCRRWPQRRKADESRRDGDGRALVNGSNREHHPDVFQEGNPYYFVGLTLFWDLRGLKK